MSDVDARERARMCVLQAETRITGNELHSLFTDLLCSLRNNDRAGYAVNNLGYVST